MPASRRSTRALSRGVCRRWSEVEGPLDLRRLHPFQKAIAQRITELVGAESPARGLVSLPTGAGKTRVAVEALIHAFKRHAIHGALVWLAQSEELCEQAVQAWREAWRVLGPTETLRVSRLWGATNDRIVPVGAKPHVVVATYQSLVAPDRPRGVRVAPRTRVRRDRRSPRLRDPGLYGDPEGARLECEGNSAPPDRAHRNTVPRIG